MLFDISIFRRLLSEQEQKGTLSLSYIANEPPFYPFTSQRTNMDIPKLMAPCPLHSVAGNLQTLEGSFPHFLAFLLENMRHNLTISWWLRNFIKSTDDFYWEQRYGNGFIRVEDWGGELRPVALSLSGLCFCRKLVCSSWFFGPLKRHTPCLDNWLDNFASPVWWGCWVTFTWLLQHEF